jgi:hypothetical protein
LKRKEEKEKGKDNTLKEMKGDHSSKVESRGAVIPLCLGEFDHKDAEAIKELWEKTWSADSRFKKA